MRTGAWQEPGSKQESKHTGLTGTGLAFSSQSWAVWTSQFLSSKRGEWWRTPLVWVGRVQVPVAWNTLLKPELHMEGMRFWLTFYRVSFFFSLIKTFFSQIFTLLPHSPASYSPWSQKSQELTQALLFRATVMVQSPYLQIFPYFLSVCLTLNIAVLNPTLLCWQINPSLSLCQSLFHSHKEFAKLSYLWILQKLIWSTLSVGAGGHFCLLSYQC